MLSLASYATQGLFFSPKYAMLVMYSLSECVHLVGRVCNLPYLWRILQGGELIVPIPPLPPTPERRIIDVA